MKIAGSLMLQFLGIALLILCSITCTLHHPKKKFKVGFSQCTTHDVWRQNMQREIYRELIFHPEIEFVFKEAGLNSAKQVQQIQELVNEGIDLLIVSPNEAAPLTPVIDKIFVQGLPVIIVDRNIVSTSYTAFIGASNFTVGVNAGAYANAVLKGKGTVLEINAAPAGSSADIGRHNGFFSVVKNYPGLQLQSRCILPGKLSVVEEIKSCLQQEPRPDFIFCHDDRVALDTYLACQQLGWAGKIKILGVDGLSGENGGIDLVERGILQATIYYPNGGKEAVETAANILAGKPYQKLVELESSIIDASNVRIMSLQNKKVIAQQKDIDQTQKSIENQIAITNNQAKIILGISIALALAFIFGGIIFYYLQENKKINKKLEMQKEEIACQRNQLIVLAEKAKEATEAKINFFTNISHEFRTPLTLIIAPLDNLLADTKIHFTVKQPLALIHKNVIRLLRLINQLIDFRKIELAKMQLQASENDLVIFTSEILNSFKPLAKSKNISLNFFTKEKTLLVWFDTSMLDKVLFNLLSNAFKFTPDNGYIHITMESVMEYNTVTLQVEDNGIGMTQEVASHAFDQFYQAEITSQQGSGLGLSLSKALIELHHGDITVITKQGVGSTFTISLPLGAAHLQAAEMVAATPTDEKRYEEERWYTADWQKTTENNLPQNACNGLPEHAILVVEDNPDLSQFLTLQLQKKYEVLVAANGPAALQLAFDYTPDLIISDIVLPGKDGIFITHTLKNDVRTAHIPVILLTAKSGIEEKIEGMRSMADAYIVKPFNTLFLEETISSLLNNRSILREHYASELPSSGKAEPNKIAKKFINEFTAIVEKNIGNNDFTIFDICKQIGVSRVQLYRKVKALIGYNVNDYILTVRMQKAKYLLSKEELSIADVAFKVGFSSQPYFSTVFKAKFALTPSEYREKKKGGKLI